MLFVDILLARFVLTAENVRYVQKIPTRISAEILIKFSISWNENIVLSSIYNHILYYYN
jgi:hypothetical protein